MSRKSRAGTAADPVTIRAIAKERAAWTWAASHGGAASLSDWIRGVCNSAADLAMKNNGGK